MLKPNNLKPAPPKDEKQMENWLAAVANNHATLSLTHTKKEFTFSLAEQRQMIKLYTIETLAKQALEDKINTDILPRVGIIPNQEVKILYDLSVGRFAVWSPRESKKKPV